MYYKVLGAFFLFFSKIKYSLFGYASPKAASVEECIDYDIRTVNLWLFYLALYTQQKDYIKGKTVLELAPGAGLGTGISLLAKGVEKYYSIDIKNLARDVSPNLYDEFLNYLERNNKDSNIDFIYEELEKFKSGEQCRIKYICRDDFDIEDSFEEESIDIVFSYAAFEHFDDIEKTIEQLSVVCKPGAVFIAQVDLQTHSRWIRDRDPNNIYRFSEKFYNLLYFRGIPNRVRPYRYREILEKCGWKDVTIAPLTKLDGRFKEKKNYLVHKFRNPKNQMNVLSIMICAKKR